MEVTKGFSAHDATIATIIGNCVRVFHTYRMFRANAGVTGRYCVSPPRVVLKSVADKMPILAAVSSLAGEVSTLGDD